MPANTSWGLLLCVLAGINKLSAISRQSEIKLENNGYSDILLAFDETIPYSSTFIDKTKEQFTKASKVLYIATRQRAYFKDIKILVPNTWPDDPSFQSASADQTVFKSDIIITSSSVKKRSAAETRTYGGCGNQGIHIQFNTDFLFKERYPPYLSHSDKYVVHQWATFRWGVFPEYPSPGESTFYFSTAFGRLDAVKCSILLKGRAYVYDEHHRPAACQIDTSTGLYKDGCLYYAYPHYPNGQQTSVSLMDHQYIQEVTGFCDDDANYATKHNAEPLNAQNRLCSHRSTWEVISNSPDFAGGRNPPTNYTDAQLVPSFTFIKSPRKRRSVVLMDSGQTNQPDSRLLKLSQAVSHLIMANQGQKDHDVLLSSSLENVLRTKREAGSAGETKDGPKIITDAGYNLSTINQDGVKQIFPPETIPSQKQVIVFSTNQTNNPNIEAFKSAGVTLHWISLHPHPGTEKNTGASVYYSHGHSESTSHIDAVYDVIHKTQNTDTYTVKLFSVTKLIHAGQEYRDTFSVDTSIHGDLSLIVTYTGEQPFLEVTSPYNKHYNEESSVAEINTELNMIQLKIQYSDAEVGKWEFRMTCSHGTSTVSLVVSSNSIAKTDSIPIILKARLVLNSVSEPPKMAAYADVTQGHHPVTGLKVIATVFRPDDENGKQTNPYKMLLFDGGSGADIIKDDGIYSRYFPYLTGRGDYQLTVDIFDSHGTVTHWADDKATQDRNNTYSISRSAHGGSVYLHTNHTGQTTWPPTPGTSDGSDVYPPSRIIDLRVVQKSDMNMTVTLSWTAPGDDLDHGIVAKYDIKYEQNGLDLLKLKADSHSVPECAIITGSIIKPLPAASTEYLTINVTDLFLTKSKGFAFLIRGIDDFGNKGEFSNMVTVGFDSIPEIRKTNHATGSHVEEEDLDIGGYKVVPKVDAPRSRAALGPLLFLNVSLLVCFLAIALFFFSIHFRKRYDQPEVCLFTSRKF